MRYPKYLPTKGTIGLVAPSFGASMDPYHSRLKSAIAYFQSIGHDLRISPHAFHLEKCQSSEATIRAKELTDFYLDESIDFLLSIAGGERMLEILPFLDFSILKEATPKYFQGYSDNTTFCFTLTTLCDVATIYGSHAPDFGMQPLDESLKENLEIIRGERNEQSSYDWYEWEDTKHKPGHQLDAYHKIHPVTYRILSSHSSINLQGRALGGCLDVLLHLCGTPYDQVSAFVERYKQDGILWFLEVAELSPAGVIRTLWQLKEAGWFQHARGFIFGRSGYQEPFFDLTYEEALKESLALYDVPIISGADIGHLPPTFSLVHGAKVTFECEKGKGKITYHFE